MKLFVLGATGHTGYHILDVALARGHEVTAFVRSPGKIELSHPRLKIVSGDPGSVGRLVAELPGHDAVLSALGVRPPQAFRPHALVEDCARSTVAAMGQAGVNRLLLVSAAVLFPQKGMVFAFFRVLLKHIARDLKAAENVIRSTAFEWTIARPPRLTNAPDEEYRAVRDVLPDKGFSMSFRALAAFMVDAAEQRTFIREIVGLAK